MDTFPDKGDLVNEWLPIVPGRQLNGEKNLDTFLFARGAGKTEQMNGDDEIAWINPVHVHLCKSLGLARSRGSSIH